MASRSHTLLIVDDEPDVLESLRHLFHREFHVLTAPSGQEGLQLLEREEVHVILSDQRMPGMTGDEFLSRARQLAPDAVRMLFTGYADLQAVINAVNFAGLFRYIHKPWEPDELALAVRQAAQQYDLLAERRRLLAELSVSNADLTRANQELAEASQLKTAFLEVASHEFKTPITIVQGLSELLRLTNPDRSPMERGILSQMTHALQQLSRLVDRTLRMIESGEYREPLRTEPVDLTALLRESIEQVLPFIQARSLNVRTEIADNLGLFELDAPKIRDAVLNLVTNAIKFTPDGGEFAVRACLVEPDGVEIEVADRGIGLEPRALNRLFEPFFTEFDPSHHSTGDFGFNQRGLGLGLSLVKKFVELHGGQVHAESTPGEGTRITLRLPRRPCPEALPGVE